MPEDSSCLFCRIVAGEVPSDVVGSSDSSLAFRDINPQAPTHVLVIPRRHIENASSIEPSDAEVLADMFVLARQVAEKEGVAVSGYRVVLNVGPDALNSVPHLHAHVMGGRQLGWPPG